MRKIICHILKELGYKDTSEAKDGYQALLKVKNGGYDLVITDWNMPNMSGLELLKMIRKTEGINETPVLIITGQNDKSQVMQAARAGVNSFIVKPFSGKALQEKMDIIFPK